MKFPLQGMIQGLNVISTARYDQGLNVISTARYDQGLNKIPKLKNKTTFFVCKIV